MGSKEMYTKAAIKGAKKRIGKTGEVKWSYEDFEAAKDIAHEKREKVREMQDARKKKGS